MSTEQVAYGDAGPGSRTIPWDELRPGGAGGPVASHWERVWTPLEALGPEGLAIRAASLERLLRDEGVTYTAAWTPGTDTGRRRAWDLDPVPVVVDSDDWRAIEAGLVQRAELLDLVLTDLNGPRDLIRRGLIPAALLWANPAFLPPCTDVAVPGSQQLILVATDLARGPDGQMLVLADRAQMPSGVGYAIMNRLVMSRAFPSLYRDAQVHRLSAFLRRLRAALGALAPGRDDDPGVVILTPGPASPTYFEHAFLASQLGYPLVSGGDLEVHQGHVTIRSVAGRGRVDVIVRRVDADDLDPLELRPDSLLGVPGLLEAARSGRVSIVNPPGTGVLEHPALPAFLPGLARHFLGHDLLLASPALWWCGRHGDRAYVLDHLEELVLRRCGPTSQGGRSVHGAGLTGAQRDELARRIGAAPHQWVGREYVEPSVVPTLVAGTRLEARPVTVRAFLVAHGGSYLTMPGGLVKVAPSDGTADGRLFADSPGAGSGAPAQAVPPGLARGRVQRPSKDAWVLSTEPEQPGGPLDVPLAASAPVALPGRAAEHMFVIG
ncbi:MAG: circularly permuted type 2 ATP-grasp protein, partial [Acidimicrobiia bacterium]